MKTYLNLSKWLLIIAVISLSACSKSATVTPAASYISMKINGVEWKTNTAAIGGISQGNFLASGAYEINGQKEIISIVLLNVAEGTTYKFEDTVDRAIQFTKQTTKISYSLAKDTKKSLGVFKITATKTAATLIYANATFSGTAVGTDGSTIVITEGIVVNSQI